MQQKSSTSLLNIAELQESKNNFMPHNAILNSLVVLTEVHDFVSVNWCGRFTLSFNSSCIHTALFCTKTLLNILRGTWLGVP